MKYKRETPAEAARLQHEVTAIRDMVGKHYGLNGQMTFGQRGSADVAFKRQVGMALCYTLTEASSTVVGSIFGGRDHRTVLHAVKVVAQASEAYPEINVEVEKLRARALGLIRERGKV